MVADIWRTERLFRNWLSGVQLIEQSLGLLQIELIGRGAVTFGLVNIIGAV
jgi:hypothetical protein